jgi:hypothetical protein
MINFMVILWKSLVKDSFNTKKNEQQNTYKDTRTVTGLGIVLLPSSRLERTSW